MFRKHTGFQFPLAYWYLLALKTNKQKQHAFIKLYVITNSIFCERMYYLVISLFIAFTQYVDDRIPNMAFNLHLNLYCVQESFSATYTELFPFKSLVLTNKGLAIMQILITIAQYNL